MSDNDVTLHPVLPQGQKWLPVIGDCTQKYFERLNLDQTSQERLKVESVAILSNCQDPRSSSPYSEAGLVLGYVQSGKTQSFTTVASLARDNGYGIVIVLAGVTNLLLGQSIDRLKQDFGLNGYSNLWKHFQNPGITEAKSFVEDGQGALDRIKQWVSNHSKPTVLITILKQGSRIDNLTRLLKETDLSSVPTLLIDDESDQASPNNKSRKQLTAAQIAALDDESSSRIHGAVKTLRGALPKHTYLQYTATPQANLLAAKTDVLSPAFARILTPGADYVGGETFFPELEPQKYIRVIPDSEIVNPSDLAEEAPEQLIASLRSFWLGCAVRLFEEAESGLEPVPRSMMIQVSAKKLPHSQFNSWVLENQKLWKKVLSDSNSDLYETVVDEFRLTYGDLRGTYETMPQLEELVPLIVDAIDETRVAIVNSDKDALKQVRWETYRFWILIGGMKLDRGYTLRGITTTYMPRTLTLNADTLQQRARFFGYHSNYLGLVRIFISENVRSAFSKYVRHEVALRRSLQNFEGLPLVEWKRQFILDPIFRHATRPSVIGIKNVRTVLKNSWAKTRFLHSDSDAVITNEGTFSKFVSKWLDEFGEKEHPTTWMDRRQDSKKHVFIADVPLREITDFLSEMKFADPKDQATYMLIQMCAMNLLDNNDSIVADVVLINNLDNSKLQSRNLSREEPLNNIFIGRNPKGASGDQLIYVGDDKIHTNRTTLHLRYAKIQDPVTLQVYFAPWISLKPSDELTTAILEEEE